MTRPAPDWFDAKVDGDTATVTYTFSESALNQTDGPWMLEDGEWHVDECRIQELRAAYIEQCG